jgi:methylthioribose-1-phosphate isomerase
MADGAPEDRTTTVEAATPAATAEVAAPVPTAVESPPDEVDLGRRRFFRQLASDVFHATATVVGAANVLQQTSMQAASAILDPDTALAGTAAATGAAGAAGAGNGGTAGSPSPGPGARPAPTGFRTAFRLGEDSLILVDQRRLPGELHEIDCRTGADVAWAIREMVVRGAPAIGQAAAYGLSLTATRVAELKPYARSATIRAAGSALRLARPTAVNLGWAVDRMLALLEVVDATTEDGAVVAAALRAEADAICAEATRDHGLLAEHGLALLPRPLDRPLRVLTHCNTGPLACGQFGTALGVVQAAVHAGREIHVHVDETRPYLQGARLTAWELEQAGVPYTLAPDAAAGAMLASGRIDAVLVGADRIAANGDTANKIGTYPLAVLAAHHGVPFYVCAPLNSVDLATPDGSGIPIEERAASEVLAFAGTRVAPPGATAWNPAFDVTPAGLISAIVTEAGALVAPFGPAIEAAVTARREDDAAVAREPTAPAAPEAPAPGPGTPGGPVAVVAS